MTKTKISANDNTPILLSDVSNGAKTAFAPATAQAGLSGNVQDFDASGGVLLVAATVTALGAAISGQAKTRNIVAATGTATQTLIANQLNDFTATGAYTCQMPAHVAGNIVTLLHRADGTGGHIPTLSASVATGAIKYAAGAGPTFSTTAGYTDIVSFYDDGTNFLEVSRSIANH